MGPDDVPLVGRDRELDVLRTAVADAAEGRPGGVLVAAEAGGGKTRLVRALLEDGSAGLVLRAQCVDLGDPGLPYLTLVDLVRALREQAATDTEVAAALERTPFLDELTTGQHDDGPVDPARRLQVFDGTAALLGAVGRLRGPVVVVVEDLQWVDASSADFLRFLLSRLHAERLAVVATTRTEGLAGRPGVRQLLSELRRLPTVHRLDLAPWAPEEVAAYLELVGGTPPDQAHVDEVVRRTDGNPYYVGVLAQEPGLPQQLSDLLVGRTDGLPEDARAVVRCAAVAPHSVADAVLRRVVGLPDEATDRALRAAVAEGILRPDGDGYSFTHDLLRTAVHDDLLPGERTRLHAAVAAALASGEAGAARPAEVAHHYTEAGLAPDGLVWSVRAADQALAVLAPEEALRHYEWALATWSQLDDAEALAGRPEGEVAVGAARAAGLAGEAARAVELARRAIGVFDAAGQASGSVRARAELVRQLIALDARDQVVGPAEEAVRLADVGPEDAALARATLARALWAARRPAEARPQVAEALDAVRAVGAKGLEVDVLTTAALLDEMDGHRDAASARLGEVTRAAHAANEPTAELRARYALASLHYYNGDVSGSLPVLRAAVDRVAETGLRWSDSGVELQLLLAVALYVSGDLDGSLAATRAPDRPPPDAAAARLAAVGCYAAVARGLPDAEHRLADLSGSWDLDPQVGLVAGGCEADRLSWAGESLAAAAAAHRAQAHLDAAAGEGMYGGLWLSALGLAALADEAAACRLRRDDAGTAGALRQGEVLLQRVEQILARGHGRPGGLGPEGRAWHLRALAEHARLQGEPAADSWRAALTAFGYGHAYEEARCHWRLAEALAATGDREAAAEHARTAAEAADRMGAVPLARAVAALAGRSRLSGAEGGVLTPREQEVLALVAEGLTNREIGARLYISEKTASVHLSNLMAKLNVTSRTEAVTVAHRRGLLDIAAPGPS